MNSTVFLNRQFNGFAILFFLSIAFAVYFSAYWLILIPFGLALFYVGWQRWYLWFWLLIATLPWSSEYHLTPVLGTDIPDEPLMLITSFFFLLNWASQPAQVNAAIWRHPLLILLLAHLCWIGITIFFSTEPVLSVKFWLAKGWYILAFVFAPLVIFSDRERVKITAIIFLYSIGLVTAVILYRHYQLGFGFENINLAVSPFFRNHVNYSAMLVCALPVLVAAYRLDRKNKLVIFLTLLLFLIAIFFSYARGAWLAVIAGLISYYLIITRKLAATFILVIVLTIASFFWLKTNERYLRFAHDYKSTIFHEKFNEHWRATYELKDVSTAERFNRWIAGVGMVGDRWLLGYGPNSFYYQYKPFALPAFKTWVSKNEERSTVHNYFLLLAIEQGITGLLIFMILVGAMFYYAENLYRRISDRFYKETVLATGVMISMIMVVNFLSDLIETDKIGSLFFLAIAMLIIVDKQVTIKSET